MKTMQVGDLKTQFSRILEEVKRGEEIIISYGRKKTNVAVIVPYDQWIQSHRIQLGMLEGQAVAEFAPDYAMTEEEFLGE